MNSTSENRINTKDKLYTKTGIKKTYELRKVVYGGECKATIMMKEPTCKVVDKIYWNANLRFDAGYYVRKFEALGYEMVVENNLSKYVNKKKGFVIKVNISEETNEIIFLMSRISQ